MIYTSIVIFIGVIFKILIINSITYIRPLCLRPVYVDRRSIFIFICPGEHNPLKNFMDSWIIQHGLFFISSKLSSSTAAF